MMNGNRVQGAGILQELESLQGLRQQRRRLFNVGMEVATKHCASNPGIMNKGIVVVRECAELVNDDQNRSCARELVDRVARRLVAVSTTHNIHHLLLPRPFPLP